MPFDLDPSLLTGTSAAVFIMLIFAFILRKDILKSFQLDREERQKTQELHQATIKDLKEAFENSLDKICKRAEESERLAEARYNILLNKTFSDKD